MIPRMLAWETSRPLCSAPLPPPASRREPASATCRSSFTSFVRDLEEQQPYFRPRPAHRTASQRYDTTFPPCQVPIQLYAQHRKVSHPAPPPPCSLRLATCSCHSPLTASAGATAAATRAGYAAASTPTSVGTPSPASTAHSSPAPTLRYNPR
jgi:hypothetical protein